MKWWLFKLLGGKRALDLQRSCKIGTVMRYAKMKCNKRFIKVDSPNSQFILKLSASLYYSLSVNFFSERFFFFFSKRGIPARTLFIIYSNKIYDAEFLFLATTKNCCVARLTIADHSCSNKRSIGKGRKSFRNQHKTSQKDS